MTDEMTSVKEKNTAIVLAAGQGKRMKSSIQKQFMLICGKPVLYYSLYEFQNSPRIRDIILVTGEAELDYCRREIVERYGFSKVSRIVAGGKERYHSVYAGLLACRDTDYVYIHDGARPFVDEGIIERTHAEVLKSGACVAGMPVKDTIKIADESGCISYTPNRSLVWMIQTPQVFSYELVRSAYELQMADENPMITDDAMVVEQMLHRKVRLVEGSYRNIKITTPEDIPMAETLCKKDV